MLPGRIEQHDPGVGRAEATLRVEVAQMGFVIHMQPVHAPVASGFSRSFHQRHANPLLLPIGMYRRVEQKSMDAAVPGHVHKADQTLAVISADISQTVMKHGLEVRVMMFRPGCTEQGVESIVRDGRVEEIGNVRWRGKQ